ncbi:MAG: ribonuclease III [Clostridia bacterium]|nr:ribonuclease III [Clostridia bacterium]
MNTLCNRLGYNFKDPKLLETALTHPSFGGDHHVPHYQRLEFLGDAVLELAISRHLYFEFPEVDEGKLTRIRAGLVREETLCRAARRLELGKYIRLSVGEDRSGGREKPSILCDVMEAVLAAVYLDGGFDSAVSVIRRALADDLHPQMLEDHLDAKSRLQEILQRDGEMPCYEFISMQGPPHAPQFRYSVTLEGHTLGEGTGTSKQNAQQNAARDALKKLGNRHN